MILYADKKNVVAPDFFKGSLTASEVALHIEARIKSVFPQCDMVEVPIADGGEGTVSALVAGTGGKIITATVSDPLMRPIEAHYGIIDKGSTAIIEMAEASGLTLIPPKERNPMEPITYGTGELNHFAEIIREFTGKKVSDIPGAGTAGELGGALLSFLEAELTPGIRCLTSW
ncbi:MAG: glycerate kinase [Proteiniphilum sp.]|nr:glycerate kinase [Proteiniphilum sp.]MDD3909678.1 glycerate kinase [Proteiniphilum sp.]